MVRRCDVLAVGAHPDDVEIGCGGTVARLAAAGRQVGILDLTAGEMSTRGTLERRTREAEAAATALGATWRSCLDLPDGRLSTGLAAQVAAVVGAVRGSGARAVLLPDGDDPHPDHCAAAALVRQACFLAGLIRWHPELGAPHRPRLAVSYPGPRQVPAVALVIDVSAVYNRKRAALAAHASQFGPGDGTATHLSTGHFLIAIEGRDRACGNVIGVELGEGFAVAGALAADEVVWLLEKREGVESQGEKLAGKS